MDWCGYVISSTDKTAKVQPIIEPASSISSNITTSRDPVIAKGILNNSNTLKVTYIPAESDLSLEDTIETSGLRRYLSKRNSNWKNKRNTETQKM